MIQSFRHKDLKPFCETGSKAGIVADHAKRLRVLLARLDAASKPEDIDLPGARLRALSGTWHGYWAVNVSGQLAAYLSVRRGGSPAMWITSIIIDPPQENPRLESRAELRVREAHHVVYTVTHGRCCHEP